MANYTRNPDKRIQDLGLKLRARRMEVGISLNGLSKIVGISGAHLANIERGLSHATYFTIIDIHEALKKLELEINGGE